MKKYRFFSYLVLFLTVCTGLNADTTPRESLTQLIRDGKSDEIMAFMQENALDIDATSEQVKDSPLVQAATYGQVKIIKNLLENGAYVEGVSEEKRTPLTEVIKACGSRLSPSKVIEAAKLLVEHGANVNVQGADSYTPLMLAAKVCRSRNIIQFLVDAGADVNYLANEETPLILALRSNNKVAFDTLVEMGADISIHKKQTPLHWLAIDGNVYMAKILLERFSIDINERNGLSQTPLMSASVHGNVSMVKYLIDQGAEINAKTTIDIYYEVPQEGFRFSFLTKYDRVPRGSTALTFARHLGGIAVTNMLLDSDAEEYDPVETLERTSRYF